MKRLIAILLLSISTTATSGGYGYNGHGYHSAPRYYNNNANNWIAPAIIGGLAVGAITYGLTRPAPPPVQYYVPQQPVVPYGYRYIQMIDPTCNCFRWVLVPQ